MANIYEALGPELIEKAVRVFYERAFADPIIGHFFFNLDHEELITKQSQFTRALLGAKESYTGRPLKVAHSKLPLNINHFLRRQMLMREVLEELDVKKELRDEWLKQEEKLKPLIVNVK